MAFVVLTGAKLGEGTFGIVKEVVHKETGMTWACKAVNKEKVHVTVRMMQTYVIFEPDIAYMFWGLHVRTTCSTGAPYMIDEIVPVHPVQMVVKNWYLCVARE